MNADQLATLVKLARIGLATLSERQDPKDASNCWQIIATAEQGVATLAASERRVAAEVPVEGPQG